MVGGTARIETVERYNVEFYAETRTIILIGNENIRTVQIPFEPISVHTNTFQGTIHIILQHTGTNFVIEKKLLKEGDADKIFETVLQWQREDASSSNNKPKISIHQSEG